MNTSLGRDFWLYRFVQIATAVGYSASSIAAMWWVLGEYNKLAYVSYLMIPPLLISAIAQPFVAPAGDRHNKKKLMLIGLFIQLLSYLFVTTLFVVNGMSFIPLVSFEVAATFGKIIFNTGSIGILPHIVDKDKITEGMNVTDRINSTVSILGGAAGGTLVTFLGMTKSFAFLTLCVSVAIILCFFVKYNNPNSLHLTRSLWFDDVKCGFNYTVRNKVVLGFFSYSIIIGLAFAPMIISLPYLIKEINGLPPFFVGLLTSSMGGGVIVGSMLYPHAQDKISKITMVYLSSFIFFLSMLIISLMHNAFFIFLGQFMIGFSRNWINVTIDSMLLKHLPDKLRTRVLSNLMFFATINMPVAMLASGFIMDNIGVYNLLLILSGVCFISMISIISNKMIRQFLAAMPNEADELLKE